MDLRETLNLPDAAFTIPMKADLPQLEQRLQAKWDEMGVYHLIQEARKGAPTFVLHDGPPYTNSPIHIGTALNKILKDFVLKSRTLMGFRTPYIPGFDNHGLPIEQAVLRKFHEQKIKPDVVTLRKACREHAAQYIDLQTTQFKRLGVFGLWERPYTTMDFAFEAGIIRVFKRMVEGGYIYRGLRPTLWSPTQQTALADTEIVYQDHTSTSIYVRFPLQSDPNRLFDAFPVLFAVIWTTTPWTIPGNLALAFHPELEYAVVAVGDVHYLVLDAAVERVAQAVGWTDHKVVAKLLGINIDHAVFAHPVYGRDSRAVMAEYVTTEDGTGIVHTAPGHGRDDFFTGMRNGLTVLCPVDERGNLTEEAGEFAGINYRDGDTVIVERLRELGHLLAAQPYPHSYPYSERDGKPVIFRATEQWFVGIDTLQLRQQMMDATEAVEWLPATGKTRIQSMVGGRPDWCISRQRPWGVGIPIFYGKNTREPLLDPEAIEAVARLVERHGSDAWFEREPDEILPKYFFEPGAPDTEYVKETDVLDVWFDSGSTNLCVFEGEVEPMWQERWPADLYLEGSDQHRGWFNSSLVIGTAIRGSAPYRQVLTHGFVMDDKGLKMSKRLGNVVDPVLAAEKFGADVIRYWVSSVDWENDVPCSEKLLQQFGENYRTVRNTLRFLLGNLSDLEGDPEVTHELDLWLTEQVDLLVSDCLDAYERYDFGSVLGAIHNFCAKELSRFYLDSIKDRMYCDGKDWPSRRSAQAACLYTLTRLTKLLAPILCHTAEEVYDRIPVKERLFSVHAEVLDSPPHERLASIEEGLLQSRFATMLECRATAFAAFESWKATQETKDSQDVVFSITDEASVVELLQSFGDDLAIYFKCSAVRLGEGAPSVSFEASPYSKCERSRLRRPDVEEVQGIMLTRRDRKAIGWD